MAIFIDSAKESEARAAREYGWVRAVTTNPVLLAQSGLPPQEALERLAALAFEQLYYQLVSQNLEAMLEEARPPPTSSAQGWCSRSRPRRRDSASYRPLGKSFPVV